MAIVSVFSHPEIRVFKSSLCSKATFFGVLSFLFAVVPPFFVAFASRTFWLKEDFYLEKPRVRFKHEAIAILYSGQNPNDARVWSTYENFNLLNQAKLAVGTVSVQETNSDVDIQLTFQTGSKFHVQSVVLLLVFQYDLSAFVRLTMEGLSFIHLTSALPSSSLFFDADLRLRQNSPLPHRGRVRRNDSVIPSSSKSPKDFDVQSIIKAYKNRDIRTELNSLDHVWTPGVAEEFVIQGHLRYPEVRVSYRPGVAQLLKWAWIQYLSILVIFVFVIQRLRAFIFLNQIIPTISESRLEKIRRH